MTPRDFANRNSNQYEREQNERAMQQRFQEMRAAADRAAQRHPHLRAHLTAIIAAYEAEYPAFRTANDEAFTTIRSPGVQRGMLLTNQRQYQQRVRDRMFEGLTQDSRRERQEAWQALGGEMVPESIAGPVIRQFYNSDRGGVQWGGLAGAVVGGLAGYSVSSSAGGGGWITAIGTLLAVGLGTWAGNGVANWMTAAPTPTGVNVNPDGQQRAPQRTITPPGPVRQMPYALTMAPLDGVQGGVTANPDDIQVPNVPNTRNQPRTTPTGQGGGTVNV